MNKQARLPLVRAVHPAKLFDICFKTIDRYGLHGALQGSKKLVDFLDEPIEFEWPEGADIDNHFLKDAALDLSLIEGLSLAYLSLYYKHAIENAGDSYLIGFEIEDSLKKETEQYICDGLLMQFRNGKQIAMLPFQETKAIGILKKDRRQVEDIIITSVSKKITKRKSYNDICGLLISILPSHSNIDYRKIVNTCDLSVYDAVFALEYVGDNLRSCVVHDLLALRTSKDRKPRAVQITPTLTYE